MEWGTSVDCVWELPVRSVSTMKQKAHPIYGIERRPREGLLEAIQEL